CDTDVSRGPSRRACTGPLLRTRFGPWSGPRGTALHARVEESELEESAGLWTKSAGPPQRAALATAAGAAVRTATRELLCVATRPAVRGKPLLNAGAAQGCARHPSRGLEHTHRGIRLFDSGDRGRRLFRLLLRHTTRLAE